MAIYHLETKVVSRGTGRSAVAAAAYMSCSQILNDYDGVQHDFTRKKRACLAANIFAGVCPCRVAGTGSSLERRGRK